MTSTRKNGQCRRCNTQRVAQLYRQITISGSDTFVWVCETCKIPNPFSGDLFIAKHKVIGQLTADELNALPVLMPPAETRCVVCGERKAELHHWAPKFLFGGEQAELWPKDFLCKKCHDEWHAKVTPQICK